MVLHDHKIHPNCGDAGTHITELIRYEGLPVSHKLREQRRCCLICLRSPGRLCWRGPGHSLNHCFCTDVASARRALVLSPPYLPGESSLFKSELTHPLSGPTFSTFPGRAGLRYFCTLSVKLGSAPLHTLRVCSVRRTQITWSQGVSLVPVSLENCVCSSGLGHLSALAPCSLL